MKEKPIYRIAIFFQDDFYQIPYTIDDYYQKNDKKEGFIHLKLVSELLLCALIIYKFIGKSFSAIFTQLLNNIPNFDQMIRPKQVIRIDKTNIRLIHLIIKNYFPFLFIDF